MKVKGLRITALLLTVVTAFFSLSACKMLDKAKKEVNEEIEDISEEVKEIKGSTDTANYIGEEKAKEIALSKEGFSPDEVVFEKVRFDMDDGIPQYEVEFRKDSTEYEFEIHAETGKIISSDVDYND